VLRNRRHVCKLGFLLNLALFILLTIKLNSWCCSRFDGQPLYVTWIFLSLALLLGMQVLLKVSLSVTNLFTHTTKNSDDSGVPPSRTPSPLS
jgi:hypothetical protein